MDTIQLGQTFNLATVFYAYGDTLNYYGHFTDSTKVDTGTYIVVVTSLRGCKDSATVTVVYGVDSTDTTVINRIYKVNANGVMQIYPNPAKAYVMIETDKSAVGGSIQISDAMGREILLKQVTACPTKIETSTLAKGVYFVRLSAHGASAIRKLVLE